MAPVPKTCGVIDFDLRKLWSNRSPGCWEVRELMV